MDIYSNRLKLTEISRADLEDIHRLHSFPEVDEFNTLGIPQSMGDTEAILQPLLEEQRKIPQATYTWKIILEETLEFIGIAGMNLSNDKFRLGEIYYKLLPAHWGKGYATEVAKALIRFGFDEMHLHKIEAGVAIGNTRSIRVLEKSGMTREGVRRKILPIRGDWVDNYHYAIVEDDPRDY